MPVIENRFRTFEENEYNDQEYTDVFLKKLSFLMKEKKVNKHSLSLACKIPYTTIDGWYKRGCRGMKISTLIKLADFFQVDLEYLVRPSITTEFFEKNSGILTSDEKNIIAFYRMLNDEGRSFVQSSLRICIENPCMKK